MRYPPEDTAARHEQILAAASRMFRERGFEDVTVADVMKAAGLTHGAFPAHFDSKEALTVEAVERALAEMLALAEWASKSESPKTAYIAQYLSRQHRDNPGHGCAMAALAPDISRKSGRVRSVFTTQVAALADKMAQNFLPRRQHGRADAIAALSTLIGAITLARAVDDPAFSDEILAAARAQFGIEPEEKP